MDERILLIDKIVTTLAQNMSPKTAAEFIRYAKKSLEYGSPALQKFGAAELEELSAEQKEQFCKMVAEEFLKIQNQN